MWQETDTCLILASAHTHTFVHAHDTQTVKHTHTYGSVCGAVMCSYSERATYNVYYTQTRFGNTLSPLNGPSPILQVLALLFYSNANL